MSKRRKNPRKRPSRTRRHRESVAAKRRARAFWAMRREKREPAEPPEPAWFRIARIWAAALLAGYFAWTVVKWIID